MIKRRPHHDLRAVQAKFANVETLEITRTAVVSARALGYGLSDIVEAVQALARSDFVKSETAHSPPVPGSGTTAIICRGTVGNFT